MNSPIPYILGAICAESHPTVFAKGVLLIVDSLRTFLNDPHFPLEEGLDSGSYYVVEFGGFLDPNS